MKVVATDTNKGSRSLFSVLTTLCSIYLSKFILLLSNFYVLAIGSIVFTASYYSFEWLNQKVSYLFSCVVSQLKELLKPGDVKINNGSKCSISSDCCSHLKGSRLLQSPGADVSSSESLDLNDSCAKQLDFSDLKVVQTQG